MAVEPEGILGAKKSADRLERVMQFVQTLPEKLVGDRLRHAVSIALIVQEQSRCGVPRPPQPERAFIFAVAIVS